MSPPRSCHSLNSRPVPTLYVCFGLGTVRVSCQILEGPEEKVDLFLSALQNCVPKLDLNTVDATLHPGQRLQPTMGMKEVGAAEWARFKTHLAPIHPHERDTLQQMVCLCHLTEADKLLVAGTAIAAVKRAVVRAGASDIRGKIVLNEETSTVLISIEGLASSIHNFKVSWGVLRARIPTTRIGHG